MVIVSDQVLKTFFQTGDKPTASQFSALIDSKINKLDDAQLLGLRTYDSSRLYTKGDAVIYDDVIYECTGLTTTGTFQFNDWKKIAGGIEGGLNYKGTWDATTNTPNLATISPENGDYYLVAVAGNTDLDGITDWTLGDWAISNGELWQKINHGSFDDENISQTSTWSSHRINEAITALDESKEPLNPNIQEHIVDIDNPHNTTKDQLGLGNVTNEQQVSLKFTANSEEANQNNTTEFETKLALVFTPEVSGFYMGQWYFELGSTKEGTQMDAKVTIGTSSLAEVMRISQHGLITQFDSVSGMASFNLEADTEYEVTIQYRKRVNGTPSEEHACRIRRARLAIFKV